MQESAARRRPIPILTYHQIAPAPPAGAPFRSLVVDPRSFERQMAWLARWGYSGLSMGALLPYLRGERAGKVVGLTFDDGYLNNLSHALPALQRHGFSATCYAVSARLGQSNLWDQAHGVAQVPLMDAAALRAWVQGGQEVGAHTRTHAHLPSLSAAQAHHEIAASRHELQDLLGRAVEHFCYPYGAYGAEHVALVREAGFASATTTRRGRVHPGPDLLQLQRVPVLRRTAWPLLWLKLATGYEDRRSGVQP